MTLYGRHHEKAELDRVLDGAREGSGAGLVLWGDPGIGKTALLEDTALTAADFTVLCCRGTRMESGLAFAALHELLWPVVDRIGTLPAAQAAALRGALGHHRDPADRFLIGAATLTLLSELAGEQPVLLAVDDAQWLDEPTVDCLCFVARRLRTEPVALLLATHADPARGPWGRLPSLEVTGLADADARLLARAARPGADELTLDRTVRVAAGNPLALQELPGTLDPVGPEHPGAPPGALPGALPGARHTAESAAPAAPGLPEAPTATPPFPVGPRLRRAFHSRIDALTPAARTLLLLIATEERGEQWVLREAAAELGAGDDVWDEVRWSGLLTARDGRVRVRHPLVRAVVYEDAPFAARRAAHRALARALAGEDADELRAWHLAAACDGPDEEVAALLTDAASRAWARGGCASAERILRRAAELSPGPAGAAVRLARGARAAWEAGRVDAARELLDRAARLSSDEEVAEVSGGLRGLIEFAHGDQETAHRHLLRDVPALSRPEKAVELAGVAVRAGWSAGSPALQDTALRVLTALPDVPPALPGWWREEGTAPALTDEAVAHLGAGSWRLMPPAPLAIAWGAEEALAEALERKVAGLRRTDAATALVLTVPQTATLDLVRGRWADATANAAETLRLAEEIGADHAASQCRNVLAWTAAARGDEAAVEELSARALERSVPRGMRALTAAAYWSRGQLALHTGRAEEASGLLERLSEPGHDAAHGTFALLSAADAAEAAVRAGRPEAALPHARRLREWADRTGTAWAAAAADRCAALLAEDPAEAEALFRSALAGPGAAARPFDHARTRLLYGEWLRRARRRTDARAQLAEAAETFRRLGAAPLLARALTERELTGRQPRRPGPGDTGASLTPQERRVARLAAEGLTNREIAARLLISPRTVGHHLSNVFPKIGVTCRTELTGVDFEDGPRLTR
ncbi:helix-turn-helix transcriptional regulator [Streptomyces albireticuli]|nr:LuxR family transcriptional regulator [Streptomyces albireticuli]